VRVLAWVISNAIAIAVAAWIFDGIWFSGPTSGRPELTEKILPLLVVALIMGVVTAFVKPVLTILSIPFIILTFGLFLFVVNALMLMFVAWIADVFGIGFHVEGFWTAVGGAIVITVVGWVVDGVLGLDD
jgi:putative membrane protein